LSLNKIDIVLASFNGSKYIKEQIESIQLCNGYDKLVNKIIISDDYSSDDTKDILYEFGDEKICFHYNKNAKGPVGNFAHGLSLSTASFVMFSDQDDVWYQDKLEKFYEKAILLDDKNPGAVYSDLLLVNDKLLPLGQTFFSNENIPHNWGTNISNLYLQNVAPGCAMLINRCCVNRVFPMNEEKILMHDWWVLLFSSVYSNVIVINEPLTRYRQHSSNVIGASVKGGWKTYFQKLKMSRLNFHRAIRQIGYFKSQLTNLEMNSLESVDKSRLDFLSNFYSVNFNRRFGAAICTNRYKSTLIRDLGTRIFILIG
jgi:glycosyltransferase involved in cell wall biosynthesis